MLSKGQEWDWFGDPFWRVQTLAVLFVVGITGLIFWELRSPYPVVNFRPLAERNFSICCIIVFFAYAVLYGSSTSLPGLLQSLFGYNALDAGLVMSPAGLFAVIAMPIIGFMIGRGSDARWLIGAGLLLMAISSYWMSQMNLFISPSQVIWPRVVLVLGLSICFAPANVAAYLYTPVGLRGAAVGLLVFCATREAASGHPWRRPCMKGEINFMRCGLANISIVSIQQSSHSSIKFRRNSFSKMEIQSPRGSSRYRRLRLYATSSRPHWRISTAFGCSPF